MTEDSEGLGKSSSPSEPTSNSLTPEEEPKSTMEAWSLSPRALVAGFMVLVGVCIFHPSMVNLLVRSENPDVTMSYVNNFYFWSRRHRGVPQDLVVGSQNSLLTAHFYPRQTYFIVHGFLGSGKDDWIINIKEALLTREDCNVISVSWEAGANTVAYPLVQSRVPEVGHDISKLLRFLEQGGNLTPDLIHLIGHSLGAHIVGFAGKRFNGTLHRITGLDPAGLLFHMTDASARLDRTDALFVDVIHTHGCTTILNTMSDCFGIDENLGDADFWPNGGERQPACMEGGDGDKLVREGSDCNHGMAYVLYTESIIYSKSTTRFLARPCHSWQYFNNHSCPCNLPGQPVQYMGYNVNPYVLGRFFLNTSHSTPYALLDFECPAGVFSPVQLLGLIMLSILTLIMMLIVVAAVVQQYYGIPILTRMRIAMGIDGGTWHGYPKSSSSQYLAEDVGDQKVIT